MKFAMPVSSTNHTVSFDNIVPYFQPIMDLSVSRVWRYECLARLLGDNEHAYLPSEFLQLLARDSDIQALASTMFSQSARYFYRLNMPWSINLDAVDIGNQDLIDHVTECLENYPNPKRVSVELTAATALSHNLELSDFIEQTLPHGLGVFIDNITQPDDNLFSLLSLPLRGIKLSAAMLSHYEADPTVQTFVGRLIDECSARNLTLIAEHIENRQILALTEKLTIRYAQGFVFSKPQAVTPPH